LYNIIFAKNEMMFDEIKVAVVIDIFWRLLEFDPEDPNEKGQGEQEIPGTTSGQNSNLASPQKEVGKRS